MIPGGSRDSNWFRCDSNWFQTIPNDSGVIPGILTDSRVIPNDSKRFPIILVWFQGFKVILLWFQMIPELAASVCEILTGPMDDMVSVAYKFFGRWGRFIDFFFPSVDGKSWRGCVMTIKRRMLRHPLFFPSPAERWGARRRRRRRRNVTLR